MVIIGRLKPTKTTHKPSLSQRKSFQHVRETSPPPPVDYSSSREKIYLNLIQKNSSLNLDEVFSDAPEFFKQKIGLKKDASTSNVCKNIVHHQLKSSSSSYRQRLCSACASCQEFHNEIITAKKENMSPPLSKRKSDVFVSGDHDRTDTRNPTTSSKTAKTDRPEWKPVGKKLSAPLLNSYDTLGGKKKKASKRKTSKYVEKISSIQSLPTKMEDNPWESVDRQRKDLDGKAHSVNYILQNARASELNIRELPHNLLSINGKIVSFKGYGTENISNWFGIYEARSGSGRRLLRELDFSGFRDNEITMKICDGARFVIEGKTLTGKGEGLLKKMKYSFRLSNSQEIESLFLSRNGHGHLFIEKNV